MAGSIRSANVAAARLLAVEHKRVIGKPILAFIAYSDRRPVRTMLADSWSTEQGHARVIVISRSGHAVDVDLSTTPLTGGAGELPGVPSTVVDLRTYEDDGTWSVVRAGAVSQDAIAAVANQGR